MPRPERNDRRWAGIGAAARALCVLAALELALSGCAAPHRPLDVAAHLPAAPRSEAPRSKLSIGIAPFQDVRTRLSRRRQRPPLRLAVLGWVREGENSTGDASFRTDVAEGARQDAANTLRYAQLFQEVRLVSAAELPPDLDLVLTGEIEELVGFQYQRSTLGFFPLAGFSTRFDPPIGMARIRYRLIGPQGELWTDRIETRLQTEGVSMVQIALDALAATNERLTVELYRRWIAPEEPIARTVEVRVLDACGLGPKLARRLLEDVSDIFQREAGVRFETSVETWVAPDEGGLDRILRAASKIDQPKDGVIVVFAPTDRSQQSPLDRQRSGLARQLGRHAIVTCAGIAPQTVTVAHEMGHLFGAVHTIDRGSIMHPIADFEARFFDPANRRILRTMRERSFDRPIEGRLARSLRQLYAEAEQGAVADPDAVREALRALPEP